MDGSTLPGNVPINNDEFVDVVVLILVDRGVYVVGVLPCFTTLDMLMEA